MRLSHHGAAFIAREEGIRTHPYMDSRGLATTGVGHLITPMHRGVTANDVRHWSFPSTAAAINYFRNHDVVIYERAVRQALGKASLTQAQYDMCVSLAFNIGIGGFASSQVASNIKAGRMRAAGAAFFGWANPRVLLGRRGRESRRFLLGHW
jgi:GH24 family phage-related lysozyme (muramidase)